MKTELTLSLSLSLIGMIRKTTIASFENGRSLNENMKKDFNYMDFLQEHKLTKNSRKI